MPELPLSPTILVLFGATGDLASRKIIPSLYNLYRRDRLPKLLRIIGFSRQELTDEIFRERAEQAIREFVTDLDEDLLQRFLIHFTYQRGEFTTVDDYKALAERLGYIDGEWKACANKLFYLAVPPTSYRDIFEHLASSGLTIPCSEEEGWTRVIVEKPFGRDMQTAKELDDRLSELFKEEQIYRIDHYLAKDMVQSILSLRFSNSLFEQVWNNSTVERIEVRLNESLGIETRGDSYDAIGALRDVGQNHLLQMLVLSIMDNPGEFDAQAIRQARLDALNQLVILTPEMVKTDTVRAQYKGYRDIEGVAPDSETETYFRITASSTCHRWQGIPFILEAGKQLQRADKEIILTFRHPSPCLCPEETKEHQTNKIRISLEPREAITISFWLKKPGLEYELQERTFDFMLHDDTAATEHVDAYERLLLDCIRGDQTLFLSTDEIKAMWRFIDPIRQAWDNNAVPLKLYEPGSEPKNIGD